MKFRYTFFGMRLLSHGTIGITMGIILNIMNASAQLASQPLGTISGTFIQYQSWMLQLDSTKWTSELNTMTQSGINTLVLQWLKADQTRFFPVNLPGNDPTEIILSYADQHEMKVYLGVYFDRSWWAKWDDEDFLNKTVKKNLAFAADLLKKYGKHKAIAGWYIPYEMSDGDFDDTEVNNFQLFLKTFTTGLKKLTPNPLPVSFSVFFQGKVPPAIVQKLYTKILANTSLDILMIQDGVGAHNWDDQVREKIKPYFDAYQEAARLNGIEVWSVLESFKTLHETPGGPATRAPGTYSRIKEQLLVHSAQNVKKILTFDFFHYMSPLRGNLQNKLFQDYQNEFFKNR